MRKPFLPRLTPGDPISKHGLARGLMDMDHALRHMRGIGIDVQWAEGDAVPVLVPQSLALQASLTMAFRLRFYGGKIEVFFPGGSGIDKLVTYNGRNVASEDTYAAGWTELYANGDARVIYLTLVLLDDEPDYTFASAAEWVLTDTPPTTGWRAAVVRPIGVVAAGGVITQYHVGQMDLTLYDGDATILAELPDDAAKYRSIDRVTNLGQGRLQLNGFAAGTAAYRKFDDVKLSFVIREETETGGIVEVRYLAGDELGRQFTEFIQELLDAQLVTVPPGDISHPGLNTLEWEDSGHISGDGGPWIAGFDATGAAVLTDGTGIVPRTHATLPDLVAGTGADDHRNLARGGVGSNVSYANLDGDKVRNACGAGMEFGDSSGESALAPGGRKGTASDGATESLNWATQQAHIAIQDLDTDITTGLTDDSGGTPTDPWEFEATSDSVANDNWATLAVILLSMNTDMEQMKTEIEALRDALQAYKIIAGPPAP
jgi:hypothetical protein